MNEILKIRNAQDAIAAIPYLLGFHPSDSLVCLAFDGPRGTCAVRQDLDDADDHVAAVVARNGFRRALLLGYGDAARVSAAADVARRALGARGVEVLDALRVADGRWWSLHCARETCCPPEGRPCAPQETEVAATAVYAGHVALADRSSLASTLAPVTGASRAAMRAATVAAEARLTAWANASGGAPLSDAAEARLTGWANASGGTPLSERVVAEGVPLVARLTDRCRAGEAPPPDAEAAWLTVLLTSIRVRDEAWVRIDPDAPSADIAFWRDLTRRAERRYRAAPASLLAFAAHLAGDGVLANLALDEATKSDPAYSMSALLRTALTHGLPPKSTRLNLTPTDLATLYSTTPDPPPT
ncbi:DUF4192 domain-containing protein [Actinomadura flavalba]|uniref:DUF4192 domain-containing protein n=1 Tax=Actinomadura flavalba TaxID=1120938 RepID=UPI00036AE024|nr:DUF4192 domain-containing protein [Actinomadura flavalba]